MRWLNPNLTGKPYWVVKGNLNSLAYQGIEHTIGKTIKANKNWKNIGDRGSHQSLEKKNKQTNNWGNIKLGFTSFLFSSIAYFSSWESWYWVRM